MSPRGVSNSLEMAWSIVYSRFKQLAELDRRLLDLEPIVWPSFAGPRGLIATPDLGEQLDRQHEARPEFQLLGEAAFMFCEVALNSLADTVRKTVGINAEGRAWSFRYLTKQAAVLDQLKSIAPLERAMRTVYVRVLLFRDVLTVHAPAGVAPMGTSYIPGTRVKLRASRYWPDDAAEADRALRAAFEADAELVEHLPVPDGLEGDFLAWWAVDEAAGWLGDKSQGALWEYMRTSGSPKGSPGDAIALTRELIERTGSALGYPSGDWAPD
jgi:hypothetical protein